jgi:phage gp36-like protein
MYISWEDIANKYPASVKITNGSNTSSVFIAGAEAEVDAALAARYLVPFTPAHPLVRDLCIDLAYYKMSIMQEGSERLGKYIEKRLKDLIDGTITLAGAEPVASPSGRVYAAAWSLNDRAGFIDEEPTDPRFTRPEDVR